jgi:hypothetical protein
MAGARSHRYPAAEEVNSGDKNNADNTDATTGNEKPAAPASPSKAMLEQRVF